MDISYSSRVELLDQTFVLLRGLENLGVLKNLQEWTYQNKDIENKYMA